MENICFIIIVYCFSDLKIRITDFSNEILNTMDLSLDINMDDVLRNKGIPEWKGNIQGYGVYVYDNIVIYFNDIVGYYENGKFNDNPDPGSVGVHFIEIRDIENYIIFEPNQDSILSNFGKPDAIEGYIMDSTFLNRVGRPEDCSNLVEFLCSSNGGWINGQLLYSTGGIKYK